MATSSCSFFTPIDLSSNKINPQINSHKNGANFSFLGSKTNLQHLHIISPTKPRSNRDLIVRNINATLPEAAAGDLLSSFSLPTISDTPWVIGIVGLVVGVPFLIQWLTKEADVAAETVEKLADTVGRVAEGVDKAAEELVEALPEGGIKQVVSYVEDLAEETTKETHKVEELLDKVEQLDEKLEQILENESKGTSEKAGRET